MTTEMNYRDWEQMMLSEDGEFVHLSDERKRKQYKAFLKNRTTTETNAERLEKLKYRKMIAERSILKQANVSLDLIAWAVQQAKRAQELENLNTEMSRKLSNAQELIGHQEASIQDLKKQLTEAHNADFELVTDLQQKNKRLMEELHEWQTGQSMTSQSTLNNNK